MPLRPLPIVLLLLAALVGGAWLLRDWPSLQHALPPSWRAALPASLAPPLPTLAPAAGHRGGAAALCKCRGQGRTVYTDGDCPPGLRAEAVDGGTFSVLPAAPAAAVSAVSAAPAAEAASAQSPLRRLAGPDESAVQRERVLEQALAR